MAYPDFGGGAAYGDAYEQGAGFYAAGAENESPNKGGKNSKSGQPVIPVTVCQIMVLMRETGGEGSFTLDGRDVSHMTLVGRVESREDQTTHIKFVVDDGTGKIECKQWKDESAGAWVREQQDLCIAGGYVRIFGQLRVYQNVRSITVHRVRPLEDMNEITYHMAAVMVSSIGETVNRMPSFSSPSAVAGGMKFEPSRAGISSMGMGAGVSPADRVLQIVKDRGDPSTGMSIADISSNCQMPRDAVARLMEQLSNDGKVYSTVDDEHFACT